VGLDLPDPLELEVLYNLVLFLPFFIPLMSASAFKAPQFIVFFN
jgi:hypothetical protein